MKVGGPKSGRDRVVGSKPRGRAEAVQSTFSEALNRARAEQVALVEELDLEKVDSCAAAFKESPSLATLNAYREAVKAVLKRLLDAYAVEEVRGFNRFGKRTINVLVRTVDERLDELARLVWQGAQDTLRLAAKIDEIRGLLLDYIR